MVTEKTKKFLLTYDWLLIYLIGVTVGFIIGLIAG